MGTTDQHRRKLSDIAHKKAELEKKSSQAQSKKSRKEKEASDRNRSADRASSPTSEKSYRRQAEAAQKAALAESKKIADLSSKLAKLSTDEHQEKRALDAATKREQKKDEQKAKQDRDRAQRIQRDEQRKAERQRQQDQRDAAAQLRDSEARLSAQIAAIREPKQERLRILYATASSHGDLRVDEEIRRVKAAVQASTHRDQVRIEHLPAATAGDLLDGLTSFEPHVVHFSGHSDGTVLVFDDGSEHHGPGQAVPVRAFKSAVTAPDTPPALVVLNACHSLDELHTLLDAIPIGVGMSESIGDVDAVTFATRFYRTLAEGQSVDAALATAKAEMEMNGLPDHLLPTLLAAEGVDPSTVRLVEVPDL